MHIAVPRQASLAGFGQWCFLQIATGFLAWTTWNFHQAHWSEDIILADCLHRKVVGSNLTFAFTLYIDMQGDVTKAVRHTCSSLKLAPSSVSAFAFVRVVGKAILAGSPEEDPSRLTSSSRCMGALPEWPERYCHKAVIFISCVAAGVLCVGVWGYAYAAFLVGVGVVYPGCVVVFGERRGKALAGLVAGGCDFMLDSRAASVSNPETFVGAGAQGPRPARRPARRRAACRACRRRGGLLPCDAYKHSLTSSVALQWLGSANSDY